MVLMADRIQTFLDFGRRLDDRVGIAYPKLSKGWNQSRRVQAQQRASALLSLPMLAFVTLVASPTLWIFLLAPVVGLVGLMTGISLWRRSLTLPDD
jgi:hypothetical protein